MPHKFDSIQQRCGSSLLRGAVLMVFGLSAVIAWSAAHAQQQPPLSAQASDPRALGWMVGVPPADEKVIRFTDGDYFNFPKSRWTVCHFRQLMPTVRVSRGPGSPRLLPRALDADMDDIVFKPTGSGKPMTWADAFDANYTDGIVVLHKGVIVYERYAGCLDEQGQHAAMSVTKSLIGLLGEMLVAEGALDEEAMIGALVPELAQSAFGDATLRQVLDMTTGLRYSEDYADPAADVWVYASAGSPLPKPADYKGPRSYFEYLKTVRKAGSHDAAFGYKTINTDVLGWVIARATGKSVATLLSERIWSRIGGEQAAYFTVDSTGTPYAGGGFNAGLRDMARVGLLMLDGGEWQGRRVIPSVALERIRAGGDKAAFAKAGYDNLPGWSYRGMWWISHNDHAVVMARGVHGQAIYVDPVAGMVIARFASHPIAGNAANDPTTFPAFEAVARYLQRKGRGD